jgi:hypothetical protein
MGLASFVCKRALEALRRKGATSAIVCIGLERRGKPYPDAFELYKSMGFRLPIRKRFVFVKLDFKSCGVSDDNIPIIPQISHTMR